LMQHHFRMGQGKTLAFGTSRQNHRPSAGCMSHTVRTHIRIDKLYRIIDRHRIIHAAARTVNIQMNITAPLEIIQVQQRFDYYRRYGAQVRQK